MTPSILRALDLNEEHGFPPPLKNTFNRENKREDYT